MPSNIIAFDIGTAQLKLAWFSGKSPGRTPDRVRDRALRALGPGDSPLHGYLAAPWPAPDTDIRDVPLLAVDGKYFTSASIAGSHEAALKSADQLIVRARGEQGRK